MPADHGRRLNPPSGGHPTHEFAGRPHFIIRRFSHTHAGRRSKDGEVCEKYFYIEKVVGPKVCAGIAAMSGVLPEVGDRHAIVEGSMPIGFVANPAKRGSVVTWTSEDSQHHYQSFSGYSRAIRHVLPIWRGCGGRTGLPVRNVE